MVAPRRSRRGPRQSPAIRSGGRAPLISVIIPSFNSAGTLPATLDSVLRQTFCDFEVIVVDDGSTDDTADRVAGYDDPRICYHHQAHAGNAAARNTGIARARGVWLCFLDADDYWGDRKLELQLVDLLNASGSRVSFTGGQRFYQDGHIEPLPLGPQDPQALWPALVYGQPYSSSLSGVMAHHGCFEQVGGFDEQLALSVDWDMWIRLGLCYRLRLFPEVLVHVRVHPGGANRNAELRLRMYLKCLLKHRRLFCSVLGMRPDWERSFGLRLLKYGRYLLRSGDYGRSAAMIGSALRHGGRDHLGDKLKVLVESQIRGWALL